VVNFQTEEFRYEPSHHVPCRDAEALALARNVTYEDFLNYKHENITLTVMDEFDMTWAFITDLFFSIRDAMLAGEKLVLILPQPWPMYKQVAELINRSNIDCRNLYTFNMDEYANQDGQIAPESWQWGFTHALKKYFYHELDPKLRPPESQMVGLTDENFDDYGKMITDLGGADLCFAGPGWTGHLAFIDPDAPEVPDDLEAFKALGPTKVTLSPFTLAQNSLHGSFGASGDIAAVPPMAATIGPAQVLEAKKRIGNYAIGVHGTATSWQRLITRLSLFGPVTPAVPDSVIQLAPTTVRVSHNIAATIEVDHKKGY
jgi:glucosamine-6-phosphate deaminase